MEGGIVLSYNRSTPAFSSKSSIPILFFFGMPAAPELYSSLARSLRLREPLPWSIPFGTLLLGHPSYRATSHIDHRLSFSRAIYK